MCYVYQYVVKSYKYMDIINTKIRRIVFILGHGDEDLYTHIFLCIHNHLKYCIVIREKTFYLVEDG